MRIAIRSSLVLLSIAAIGCGSATAQSAEPPAPTPVDPVGMYDFEAKLGADVRTGTLEITRNAEGGLRGEAWLEGEPDPAIIESGAVSGNHVQLTAFVGGGMPVTFELDFAGAGFTGAVTAGDQTIELTGTRRVP